MKILWILSVFLTLLLPAIKGEEIYSNSFISPNSASDQIDDKRWQQSRTSAPEHIIVLPSETLTTTSKLSKRSANPILSRTTDQLFAYKNVGEPLNDNDVEFSGRQIPYIQPSKTHDTTDSSSGEDRRAPQARSLGPQEEPHPTSLINPTATQTVATSATPIPEFKGRQANHDIQDIITGIVKLLNGNVNVQANTAPPLGRPRPLSTRINNRGPPRITDVPALPPDFDMPAPPLPPPPPLSHMPPPVNPTRIPTPYPFDLPPQNTSPVRPFYRPVTIPPWNRRKPTLPNRRIPVYKPLPDMISLTSEKPVQDILTLDLGTHLMPSEGEKNDDMKEEDKETTIVSVDKEIEHFEKNKEKSSSKMNKVSSTVKTSTSISTRDITTTSSSTTTTSSIAAVNNNTSTITPTNSTRESINPTTTSRKIGITPTTTSIEILNTTGTIITNISTTPVVESSIQEIIPTTSTDDSQSSTPVLTTTPSSTEVKSTSTNESPQTTTKHSNDSTATSQAFPYYPYRPRPGIVLDDTEYKPGGNLRQPIITRPPIGEIFDVTVSAIQGSTGGGQGKPYVIPVDIENGHDVITSPVGDEGFVSIDGKRTYLNLFGENGPTSTTTATSAIKPTASTNNHVAGSGYAVVDEKVKHNVGSVKPTHRRPSYGRPRPSQPVVRIDTCIVGDDSTCDGSQHEICRTEAGVSACHCRPGHARRKHRDPCRKIVSVLLSLRVDRLYDRRVVWANELADKNTESYQQLSYEAERALESAMSMTPFSDEFLGAKVNSIYRGERSAGQSGVFVNMTLQLDENAETSRSTVRNDIQKHLLGVIQRRSNNVGNSALWVDSPPGSITNLQDLDECSSPELHDCHAFAKCINIFGGFKCECAEGFRDPWADIKHRAGRQCDQCPTQHCNNRGECKYQNGQEVCICSGNYYGTQCELDGEVLGVAIGASVAAVIIIGLTLVCLVMWSRRWSREQKAAVGSPVFGYMATASNTVKAPVVGAPPYQLTMEDRMRWAQIADVMAQTNHYAPEPVTSPTRPSSALFGYPTLSMGGTLQHATLPPVPLPRLTLQAQRMGNSQGMRPLDNSSSSEEEDKTDLLGRHFQVPRPKSRSNASIANQSGIYYDVDYDQNEIYKQSGGIPLSTYSMGRTSYYRN